MQTLTVPVTRPRPQRDQRAVARRLSVCAAVLPRVAELAIVLVAWITSAPATATARGCRAKRDSCGRRYSPLAPFRPAAPAQQCSAPPRRESSTVHEAWMCAAGSLDRRVGCLSRTLQRLRQNGAGVVLRFVSLWSFEALHDGRSCSAAVSRFTCSKQIRRGDIKRAKQSRDLAIEHDAYTTNSAIPKLPNCLLG